MSIKQPDPARVLRIPQEEETPLTTLNTPFGTILYLYSRSNDSIDADVVGQDYIVFRYGVDNLVFAVCDGVGQSFMGDLAARILGDELVDWLWDIDRPASAEDFSQEVAAALNDMVSTSADRVVKYQLPPGLPGILMQALEMQRKYGSESMFVAGRLALTEDEPWVALAWLGDAPVAAIDIDGKLVDLGPRGHTFERWNATTGVKGEVHTWVSDAHNVARVAGYTDGLTVESVPTDENLKNLIESWVNNPPGDDASLFDVRLAPSPETTGSNPDDTGPIVVPEELKKAFIPVKPEKPEPIEVQAEAPGPVKAVEPIASKPADDQAVGEWRSLTEAEEKKPERVKPSDILPGLPTALEDGEVEALEQIGDLADLSATEQVHMWQRAAMLGLTSAALAMLMVERLIEQAREDSK